jgi:hypothetical protein
MVSKEKLKAILKRNPAILTVEVKEDEERAEALAYVSLRPSVLGALTLADYNKWVGELALDKLVSGLVEQCNATNNGDLKRTEALLTVQAHTLDAIFNNLARRAINAEYMDNLDRYLRLVLRAQSQCRATLETLTAIKNPQSLTFVRQANIGYNQQVNNGAALGDGATRAREIESSQNKLLDIKHGERLDTGTTGVAIAANPHLETGRIS